MDLQTHNESICISLDGFLWDVCQIFWTGFPDWSKKKKIIIKAQGYISDQVSVLSSEPADRHLMGLAISRSCFIRTCCLLFRHRPLGFLQSLSLTLMGSDVAHDWLSVSGWRPSEEWRERPCACGARGLIVVAAAFAHSTFAASGGKYWARQQGLCVQCSKLNSENTVGREWQHGGGNDQKRGKNKPAEVFVKV